MRFAATLTICASVLAAGCATQTMSEAAAKFKEDDVAGFVALNISNKRVHSGRPVFNAWFNDVNASRLYLPSRRLAGFCEAKGGAWERDPSNLVPSNFGQGIPVSADANIVGQHRKVYREALADGIIGSFRCTKGGKPMWAVKIETGTYSADNSMGLNSIMPLIIGTVVPASM
mgnify:CR=1 FL=1